MFFLGGVYIPPQMTWHIFGQSTSWPINMLGHVDLYDLHQVDSLKPYTPWNFNMDTQKMPIGEKVTPTLKTY